MHIHSLQIENQLSYPYHIVAVYCRSLCHQQMNNEAEARADFDYCRQIINQDQQARELFERYGEQMPLLS